jgi:hypothetical protein
MAAGERLTNLAPLLQCSPPVYLKCTGGQKVASCRRSVEFKLTRCLREYRLLPWALGQPARGRQAAC